MMLYQFWKWKKMMMNTFIFNLTGNRDRPFPQPGWIVLFCLLAFLTITAFIFMSCHKRTRKQITGFFCRKYGVLWSDPDRDATSDLMNVEGRYEEQQVTPPISELC